MLSNYYTRCKFPYIVFILTIFTVPIFCVYAKDIRRVPELIKGNCAGGVCLGDPLDVVIDNVGRANYKIVTRESGEGITYLAHKVTTKSGDLYFQVSDNNNVDRITIKSEGFKDEKGFGVNSYFKDLLASYTMEEPDGETSDEYFVCLTFFKLENRKYCLDHEAELPESWLNFIKLNPPGSHVITKEELAELISPAKVSFIYLWKYDPP